MEKNNSRSSTASSTTRAKISKVIANVKREFKRARKDPTVNPLALRLFDRSSPESHRLCDAPRGTLECGGKWPTNCAYPDAHNCGYYGSMKERLFAETIHIDHVYGQQHLFDTLKNSSTNRTLDSERFVRYYLGPHNLRLVQNNCDERRTLKNGMDPLPQNFFCK